jgi:hypothetical protein
LPLVPDYLDLEKSFFKKSIYLALVNVYYE